MVSLPSPIIPVSSMASMNADAVSFPKGVFPPDADFGKGGHVPLTHPHGSGGIPKGGESVGSPPLGCVLFGTFLPHSRKVHFDIVGIRHGVPPPRLKNFS